MTKAQVPVWLWFMQCILAGAGLAHILLHILGLEATT